MKKLLLISLILLSGCGISRVHYLTVRVDNKEGVLVFKKQFKDGQLRILKNRHDDGKISIYNGSDLVYIIKQDESLSFNHVSWKEEE